MNVKCSFYAFSTMSMKMQSKKEIVKRNKRKLFLTRRTGQVNEKKMFSSSGPTTETRAKDK